MNKYRQWFIKKCEPEIFFELPAGLDGINTLHIRFPNNYGFIVQIRRNSIHLNKYIWDIRHLKRNNTTHYEINRGLGWTILPIDGMSYDDVITELTNIVCGTFIHDKVEVKEYWE